MKFIIFIFLKNEPDVVKYYLFSLVFDLFILLKYV